MYPFGKETGGMNDFFSRRRSRLLGTGGGVLLEKACAASKDRSVGKGGGKCRMYGLCRPVLSDRFQGEKGVGCIFVRVHPR